MCYNDYNNNRYGYNYNNNFNESGLYYNQGNYNNSYNYNDYNCYPTYEKPCNKHKCWEGTFKICEPSYVEERKNKCEEERHCNHKCFSICDLFRNCCRW